MEFVKIRWQAGWFSSPTCTRRDRIRAWYHRRGGRRQSGETGSRRPPRSRARRWDGGARAGGGEARGPSELLREVRRAQAGLGGEGHEREVFGEVRFDEVGDAAEPTRRHG